MTKFSKILGCLVGAAAGDALGAATEMRSLEQIQSFFKGSVRTFFEPPADTFARGRRAGQVTDDFSLAYSSVLTLLHHQGQITAQTAEQALIEWAKTPDFEVFAGPTTRMAIYQLMGQTVENRLAFLVNDNSKSSNGAAMKAAPLALFAGGDVEQAIENACVLSMPSHDNQTSISGACAIAAATAKAMQESVSLDDVLEAGLYGAEQGELWGRQNAKTLAGPSVLRRMEWALALAQNATSDSQLLKDLSDLIGTGLPAAEAVPTVFGLLKYFEDRPMEALFAAVNIGNDTDTIATMVGGILGALYGVDLFPKDYLSVLNQANAYQLDASAQALEALIYG